MAGFNVMSAHFIRAVSKFEDIREYSAVPNNQISGKETSVKEVVVMNQEVIAMDQGAAAMDQEEVAMEVDNGEYQSRNERKLLNHLELLGGTVEEIDQIENQFSQELGQGPVETDRLSNVTNNPSELRAPWEFVIKMKNFIEGCTVAAKCYSKQKGFSNVREKQNQAEKRLDLIRTFLDLGYGTVIVETLESFQSVKATSLYFEPAIMLNAVVCMFGSKEIRRAGYNVMSKICFNSSRLFLFVAISDSLRNYLPEGHESVRSVERSLKRKIIKKTWEPMRKKAVAQFYMGKKCPMEVLYETTQCMQRYNVTHRSVLGKCRPKPKDPEKISYDLVFCYLTRGFKGIVKKYPSLKGELI